jgi:hypothetical protein
MGPGAQPRTRSQARRAVAVALTESELHTNGCIFFYSSQLLLVVQGNVSSPSQPRGFFGDAVFLTPGAEAPTLLLTSPEEKKHGQ